MLALTIVTFDFLLSLLGSHRVGTQPAGANPGIVAGRQTKCSVHPLHGLQCLGDLLEYGAFHFCSIHWVVEVGAVVGEYFPEP